MTTPDPFAALGLPARPDLDDETVRAAWRQIAAATHPDRPDGGDLARYTAASAAYAQLRTPWGRSETYADLTDDPGSFDSQTTGTTPMPAAGPGPRPAAPLSRLYAVLMIPERIRHGRPLRLVIRGGHRRCRVPGRVAGHPRPARRTRHRHRGHRVVPAHRPQRPRAPARPVTRPSASGGTSGEGDRNVPPPAPA